MKRFMYVLITGCLLSASASFAAADFELTKEVALRLEREFRSSLVEELFRMNNKEDELEPDNVEYTMLEYDKDGACWGPVGLWQLVVPGDDTIYLMIMWNNYDDAYWLLLGSEDGENFQVRQRPDHTLGMTLFHHLNQFWVRQVDLDRDGVPEVLVGSGPAEEPAILYVYRWTGDSLHLITPMQPPPPDLGPSILPSGISVEYASEVLSWKDKVVIADQDHDGVAELIAYPDLVNEVVGEYDDGTPEVGPVAKSPTRVFKMVDGRYRLWKEIPPDEPNPVGVKVPAVVQPGTISYSALSSAGKGTLRIFLSSPPAPLTLDTVDRNSFEYLVNNTELSFKKLWPNTRYPDQESANDVWGGVPVRRRELSGGQWEINPSSPALPSPDWEQEFAFVGPYLEFRIRKDVVFPFLLARADAYFEKHPLKQQVVLSIPISGDLPKEKSLVAGAFVVIKHSPKASSGEGTTAHSGSKSSGGP